MAKRQRPEQPGAKQKGPSSKAAKAPRKKEKIIKSVANLSLEAQKLLRDTLIEGDTFEDAAETVGAFGGRKLTVRAVEQYFRANLDVQQSRIRHQLQTARALKQAIKEDPGSSEAELADAVIITGLMGVRRRDQAARTMEHAFRYKDQIQNLRLKLERATLSAKKAEVEKKMYFQRLKNETTKHELMKMKLHELIEEANHEGEDQGLRPEVMDRIREIYGIASEAAPTTRAEAVEE